LHIAQEVIMATELSLPNLIAGLKCADWAERFCAAFTLGHLGATAKPAVPALIETLTDDDLHIRKAAALALGKFGPGAVEAKVGRTSYLAPFPDLANPAPI
jgi:HEAT repeat protein